MGLLATFQELDSFLTPTFERRKDQIRRLERLPVISVYLSCSSRYRFCELLSAERIGGYHPSKTPTFQAHGFLHERLATHVAVC